MTVSRPTPRPRRSLQALAPLALLLSLAHPAPASATPELVPNPSPVNAAAPAGHPLVICGNGAGGDADIAFCNIRPGWTYYWAYINTGRNDNCAGTSQPFTLRYQILARQGATGMVVGGLWMNHFGGPRRFAVSLINAYDSSADGSANGEWNWKANWNPDPADRDDINDPSRWNRFNLMPGAVAGHVWSPSGRAGWKMKFAASDHPGVIVNNPDRCLEEGAINFYRG